MSKYRLIKKTGLYFIGNLSSRIIHFLLIPLYAFYISPSDLGRFDFLQTISFVFTPFLLVAIWEGILRYLLLDVSDQDEVISSSCMFVLFMCAIYVLTLALFSKLASYKVENIRYHIVITLSYSFTIVWQYYARGLGENSTYVIASIIGTITNFLISIILLCFFHMGFNAVVIAYVVGNVCTFIYIERKIRIFNRCRLNNFKRNKLKEILSFSAPLSLNLACMWILNGFGKLIITNNLGVYENGLYSFAQRFSSAVAVLGSVISMALIEEAILKTNENNLDEYFTRIIRILFQLFQSFIIILIPLIALFYHTIAKTEYFVSIKYVPWFLLYSMFVTMSTNIGSIFQTIGKTKYIFTSTLTGALITISLGYLLISDFNISGVILAQIIGAFSMMFLRYKYASRYVRLKIHGREIIKLFLYYIITALICIRSSVYIIIIIAIINLVFMLYLNRQIINETFEFFIRRIRKGE